MTSLKKSIVKDIFESSTNKYEDFRNYFLSIQIPILETQLAISKTIYRARSSKPDMTFDTYNDYIYPPACNSFSRIGKPGDVWFYASDNYEACLAEMLPFWYDDFEFGSSIKVTFGFWQVRQPISVFVIPDFELKNEISAAMKLNERYSGQDKLFWDFISPFFYKSTKENPDIYYLTSALIDSIMYRVARERNEIDGIAYPSVQHRMKTNIALKSKVIDVEKITFQRAAEMLFKKHRTLSLNGLPSYSGPSEGREGILSMATRKIEWL